LEHFNRSESLYVSNVGGVNGTITVFTPPFSASTRAAICTGRSPVPHELGHFRVNLRQQVRARNDTSIKLASAPGTDWPASA
jgi:hypothetical protein